MSSDSKPDLDALYRLPLAQFVSARDALAAELRKSGRREDAAHVKSQARPSPPAWAVNQVHHAHPELLQALREAGELLKDAQRRGDAADFADATRARNGALAACEGAARDALTSGGHATAHATLRAVTRTLEAIAAAGDAGVEPAVGRLVRELAPPGFDALGDGFEAAIAPRPEVARPVEPTVSERREQALALAERARRELAECEPERAAALLELAQAEQAAVEARRASDRAEADLRTARSRVAQVEKRFVAASERASDAERLVALLE